MRQIVEEDVDHGRCIEREHLAHEKPANHGDSQRPAQFGTDSMSKRQRETAEQRRHGGHHDRPETQQAGFVDGVGGIFALVSLRIEREVHHHDSIFFDDAY